MSVRIEPPKFDSAGSMKKTISQALKIFDTYYRRRVLQRFASQGPGWPDRKNDDAEQRDKNADAFADKQFRRRLVVSLRNARKRYSKGFGTSAKLVKKTRMLEELKRQISGGAVLSMKDLGSESSLLGLNASNSIANYKESKSIARSRLKAQIKQRKAAGQILGRMVNAMVSSVSGNKLTVTNTIPWSSVQNEGGTVGHGAVLPPRPFQYFDDTDIEVFVAIVENVMGVALS